MTYLLTPYQILSITCDNATNNDKMIERLAGRLEDFPGAPNRARCFTHILNLVVKSIMHQFELPKKKWYEKDKETYDDLMSLAGDIEEEELETQCEQEGAQDDEDNDEPPQDNEEGWIDEREEMDKEELEELEANVGPTRVLLTKVCESLASAVQY